MTYEQVQQTEEKEVKEVKTQETTQPTNSETAGDEKENNIKLPILDQVKAERERAEAAVKELKAENDRKEKMMAQNMLGGETEGRVEPEKPSEESALDYTKRVMSGGLNEQAKEE